MFKHINRLNLNLQKIFDTQLAQSWASWSIKLHALVAGNRIQSSTTSVRTFFTRRRNSLQRSTTSTVMSSNMEQGEWQQRKKQIAAMSTEKRRKFYRCTPDQIVMLSDIPTWYDYGRIKKLFVEDSGDDDDEKAVELAKKVSLFAGDITQLEIDAIVNAANNSLLGGGGVDGAIHKAAGDMLYDECETLNGCDTGDVKITGGYNLPAKFVMHAVGPRGSGDEELASCYLKSLELARENNVRSIAFPCISTGIYAFPNRRACQLALHTIREWLLQDDNFDNITRIIFCVFLPVDVRLYEQYLPKYFPLTKSPDAETSAAAAGNEISPEKQPSPRKDVAGTPTKKDESPNSIANARRTSPEDQMKVSPRNDSAAGTTKKHENTESAADAASSAERLETSSHMDDAGNVGKDESSKSDVAVDAARTATATSPSPSKEKK